MGMSENDVRVMADALWDYIKNKHLVEYLSDSVCYYRATVTTAPSGGRIGVTRPYDSEIFVLCAGSASSLAVNDECIVLVFGDPSNAIVLADGKLSNLGGGGGGGGGYTLPAATTTSLGGVIVPSANGLSVAGDGTISISTATTSAAGAVQLDSSPANGSTHALTSGGAYSALTLKQNKIYTDSVTTTTTWSGSDPYTQVVTLSNYTVTANSKVDIQADATAIAQLISDSVTGLYILNNAGTLTMYAIGGAPTAALTLQVTITEVTAA